MGRDEMIGLALSTPPGNTVANDKVEVFMLFHLCRGCNFLPCIQMQTYIKVARVV